MKILKDTLIFLVSLALMFCFILIQASLFTRTTMLNPEFYINNLEKSDYFKYIRNEIDYGFKNYSMVTSIPENIFTESVKDDEIKEMANRNIYDTVSYFKYEKEYTPVSVDTKVLDEKLKVYIDNYAKEKKVAVSSDLQKRLKDISTEAGNIVSKHSILFNISAVSKYAEFQSFRKGIYILRSKLNVMIYAALVLLILLIFLNLKTLPSALLWLGGSLIPAGLMTLIPSLLALAYKISYRYAISITYLKEALRDITLGYIDFFIKSGLISLMAGILALLLYILISNRTPIQKTQSETINIKE